MVISTKPVVYLYVCVPGLPNQAFQCATLEAGSSLRIFFCSYHGVAQVVYGQALLPMYLAYLSTREN